MNHIVAVPECSYQLVLLKVKAYSTAFFFYMLYITKQTNISFVKVIIKTNTPIYFVFQL